MKALIVGFILISTAVCADPFYMNRFGSRGWEMTQGNVQQRNGGIEFNANSFGSQGWSMSNGRIDQNGNFNSFSYGRNGFEMQQGQVPMQQRYRYGQRW
jgi:hypothetical protein